MIPITPKMSVSPEATRNSSSPYCSALRHWTRNVATSISHAATTRPSHLAAAARVGERGGRDADHLVFLADHLAQVHVLHRVVVRADSERAARAVDLRADNGPGDLRLLRDVA